MNPPIRIELPTPFSIGPVNAYLFTAPEPILVDCGVSDEATWQALTSGLAEHGLTVGDLRHLIITHVHSDHCGMAGRIAANSDATVWVSDVGYEDVINLHPRYKARGEFIHSFFRRLGFSEAQIAHDQHGRDFVLNIWDEIPAERVKRFALDAKLPMGGAAWQVMHAPGHSWSQTCFYQPESQMLLAADMLLAIAPSPIIESHPTTGERIEGLPQLLESYKKFAALDVDIVYPGHGQVMREHAARIARQVKRIHKRKDECFELVVAGHDTVRALTDVMYARLPENARMMGLAMCVGYLDLLQAEGRVKTHEDQFIRFVPA